MTRYFICFWAILSREILRFFQQRSRLLSALVRPLLWLVVFAAGFRSALGVSIMPPYESYILYQEYICLLYTSPSPRDGLLSRMPSSA